jgi:hypothetical protein
MKKIASLLIIILIGVAIDADAKKKLRKFYLTQTGFNGSQALNACDEKYHMASLWEIFDVSTLQYDTQKGFVTQDSGSGPPVSIGWVRTGFGSSNNSFTPGVPNCNAWTTTLGNGTVVDLFTLWNQVPTVISPWRGLVGVCVDSHKVWCVQD